MPPCGTPFVAENRICPLIFNNGMICCKLESIRRNRQLTFAIAGDGANGMETLTGMNLLPSPMLLATRGDPTSRPAMLLAAAKDCISAADEPKNKRRKLPRISAKKKQKQNQEIISLPNGFHDLCQTPGHISVERSSDLDESGSSLGISMQAIVNSSMVTYTDSIESGRDSTSTLAGNCDSSVLEADEEEWVDEEWEVQDILDHCCYADKQLRYFVKWRGWDVKFNSWEVEDNLANCPSIRERYWKKVYGEFEKVDNSPTRAEQDAYRASLSQGFGGESLQTLMKNYGNKMLIHKERTLMREVRDLLRSKIDQQNEAFVTRLKKKLQIRAFQICRQEQTAKLKQWEEDVNAISTEHAKVLVENLFDLEGPPENFDYVNDYVPGTGVVIPTDPPIGCDCRPSCLEEDGVCCGVQSGGKFAYTDQRRLRVKIGTPIYECNSRCTCPPTCNNRVVQAGRRVELCIFRTSTGCGWGVKTPQPIKRGTFVCEYVGEVIKSEEAERRGKIYDAEGRTYLFDLDYNDKDQFPYTVDAAKYGNVSHFINHSCDPNLAVFAVWVNCLDPNLPKLALFATRNIKRGEEITFDYMCQSLTPPSAIPPGALSSPMGVAETTFSPISSPSRGRLSVAGGIPEISAMLGNQAPKTLCKCNADKCRRYLF